MRLTCGDSYQWKFFKPLYRAARRCLKIAFLLAFIACSGARPGNLGVGGGRLAPCPSSPNCVSSDDTNAENKISPLQLAIAPAEAWDAARAAVLSLSRSAIITNTENYLHAECRSQFFGFVDDLELHLRPSERLIAVRSAARLGYSDFGVNRERVEQLRALLQKQSVIR